MSLLVCTVDLVEVFVVRSRHAWDILYLYSRVTFSITHTSTKSTVHTSNGPLSHQCHKIVGNYMAFSDPNMLFFWDPFTCNPFFHFSPWFILYITSFNAWYLLICLSVDASMSPWVASPTGFPIFNKGWLVFCFLINFSILAFASSPSRYIFKLSKHNQQLISMYTGCDRATSTARFSFFALHLTFSKK